MRRYEFKEGTSNKFWEIELEGESFTTRYGKIGTDGQETTKDFDSAAEARKAYDKLILEKEKKGYVLVSGGEGTAAAATSNPELEAMILARPEDPEGYLVYGDWLQAHGDPRGQLIAVQAALLKKPDDEKLKRQEKDLLTEHQADFLGELPELAEFDEDVALTWRLGFLRDVSIGGEEYSDIDAEGACRILFGLASAKFLRSLSILVFGTEDGNPDYGPLIKALAKLDLPPTLRSLKFSVEDFQISWSDLGDLAPLYPKLARLEELAIKMGKMDLGDMKLPGLVSLEIITGGLTKANLRSVAKASWPRLEKLVLYFGTEEYGGDCGAGDLAALLEGKNLGQLRHLGLSNAEFADELAAAVPAAKILGQLHTLDLSKGAMTDEGANALLAQAEALKHLKRLDLSQNYLSDEVAARLVAALTSTEVDVDDQGDPNEEYRYVQVAE
jgi:uncharacterized protein (TIGR02996 family)